MPYSSEDHYRTGRYFKVASGYVPNQFSIRIIKENVLDQESGIGGNPLYLINLEPWVIEELVLPQIQFNIKNDVYMDADSLIQPDYISNVITTGEISLKIREKSDLAIHRSLIRCQKELYNSLYEGSGSLGETYSVIVTIKSQRLDDRATNNDNIYGDNQIIFGRAILSSISNPTYSYAEDKFLRYDVKIQVNCMAETYSLLGRNNMKEFKQAVGSTLGVSKPTVSTPKTIPTLTEMLKNGKPITAQQAEEARRIEASRSRSKGIIDGIDYTKMISSTVDETGTRELTFTPEGVEYISSKVSQSLPTEVVTGTGKHIPINLTDPQRPILPTAPALVAGSIQNILNNR